MADAIYGVGPCINMTIIFQVVVDLLSDSHFVVTAAGKKQLRTSASSPLFLRCAECKKAKAAEAGL